MPTNTKKLGNKVIKWKQNDDRTFSGGVVSNGKMSELIHDENEERLLTRLHNEAGKLEPSYFGMDGAIARFCEFMPGGFKGQIVEKERDYKVHAHETLNSILSAEQALEASEDDAARLLSASKVWINLLSPYESMHLKDCLKSPTAAKFLRAAAQFASGDVNSAAAAMHQAIKAHGPLTWPTATYFPFLWDPDQHMFLKPGVTRDFAERVGHPFQYVYESAITREVYASLLDLTNFTKQAIQDLQPRDNIDVQSFIWVVGAYTEADKPQ